MTQPAAPKPAPFRDALQRTALVLRNAAPGEWDGFLSALADYSQDITLAVIEAPPNEILKHQGRAQMMLSLHRMFEECDNAKTPQPAAPTQPVP
jgi:hypothetical protein